EWIAAATIDAGTAATGYPAYKRFYVKDHHNKSMVNPHIHKNPKVRFKEFPLCDGSNTKHNEENRDNVGPLTNRGSVST
ncbi:hypothetical protein FD755_019859, partial [Muntiacus reevesi]